MMPELSDDIWGSVMIAMAVLILIARTYAS
jgi:hypothetical protein